MHFPFDGTKTFFHPLNTFTHSKSACAMAKKRKKLLEGKANKQQNEISIQEQDEKSLLQTRGPSFKEDINAFSIAVENGKDFISRIPSETLENILSFCLLDHDPDRGVKMEAQGKDFVEDSHALLSLAAMSRHFRDRVESFSLRTFTKPNDIYGFETNDEQAEGKRRSDRLKLKSTLDSRCYRIELVKHWQAHCIDCNKWCVRRAVMGNEVACHDSSWGKVCEDQVFPETIVGRNGCLRLKANNDAQTLTEALKEFDHRHWMLIPSRKTGPRMNNVELPVIP